MDISSIETFHSSVQKNDIDVLRKIMPLVQHEYTHFLDATSTLWGIRHLKLMNDAYSTMPEFGGKRSDYYKAKLFENHLRTIILPESFSETLNNIAPTSPWTSELEVGTGYSTLKPDKSGYKCLYTKFYNSQGDYFMKEPLAPISIFEATAISADINMNYDMINSISSHDNMVVEKKLYSKKATQDIFDPRMIKYYMCHHILNRYLDGDNGLAILRVCEYICRVVLNVPKSVFAKISEYKRLNAVLEVPFGHSFEIFTRKSLQHHHLGVLFFLICVSMPKESLNSPSAMESAMDQALHQLGISLNEVTLESAKEAQELYVHIESSQISSIRTIAAAGMKNKNDIPLNGDLPNFHNLSLPPVFLSDMEPLVIFGSPNNELRFLDLNELFYELHKGEKWVNQFSNSFFF